MSSLSRLAGEVSDTSTPLDTSTNALSILAINGFFCGFSVLVVLLRGYVRAVMLKTVGVDDYLMFVATVRSFPFSIVRLVLYLLLRGGTLGPPIRNICLPLDAK